MLCLLVFSFFVWFLSVAVCMDAILCKMDFNIDHCSNWPKEANCYKCDLMYSYLPVVPHKAVAEVSRIGNYRRDWLL